MYSLFSEFDPEVTSARVKPKMDNLLRKAMYEAEKIPNFDGLSRRFTMNVVTYIEEMVDNHGQESRCARQDAIDAQAEFGVLDSMGLLRNDWGKMYFETVKELLFDELRRCGVGKVGGTFVGDWFC